MLPLLPSSLKRDWITTYRSILVHPAELLSPRVQEKLACRDAIFCGGGGKPGDRLRPKRSPEYKGGGFLTVQPRGIQKNETSVAETIENNVRKLIIDEHPINPKYYERLSQLLDALIEQRVGLLGTQVSDLSPLEGMKLTILWCDGTKVTDLTVLRGMPLVHLRCDFKTEQDRRSIRSITTLETINDKPAKQFWKEMDDKK